MFLSIVGFIVVLVAAFLVTGMIGIALFVVPTFGGGRAKVSDYIMSIVAVVAMWTFVWWICPFTISIG